MSELGKSLGGEVESLNYECCSGENASFSPNNWE